MVSYRLRIYADSFGLNSISVQTTSGGNIGTMYPQGSGTAGFDEDSITVAVRLVPNLQPGYIVKQWVINANTVTTSTDTILYFYNNQNATNVQIRLEVQKEQQQTTYKATVYFNANGGYGEPSSVYGTTTNSDRYCVVNIPNIRPIRDGYDFQGWALSSPLNPPSYQPGGTITLYGNAISSSSDIGASYTLYAIWKESVSGGYVYISNGSVFNKYEVWIYTNSWKRCTPYIYTNAWNNC